MDAFHVWIHPMNGSRQVRVDGIENAKWLIHRLGQFFVFKTAEPLREDGRSSCCTFRVADSSQITRHRFERLLGAIPEVKLMLELA
ncbi:MAG: hypothetical protein HQ582_15705 [Planctomycetes bacterium]|nr:hypothetical protein [Planctomycetota bacterium]